MSLQQQAESTPRKEPTPLEKMALRDGGCVALACTYGCAAFASVGVVDGYATCVCGRTQWAHEEGVL